VQPANIGHATTQATEGKRAAQALADGDSTYTVHGGKDGWLKEFDKSKRMTNQFRTEEFVPQKEGFVRVKKPEAHFFLKGGQWLRVIGDTGEVVVPGMNAGGNDPFSGMGGGSAPKSGRLQNVRIQLYEAAGDQTPTLDMEMNNAAFDNESFRIFTEAYTDRSGKQIAADEVKVTVRGKYEFDGRGLTIRWNDLDRRLDLLEIAHGERLVIKDPGALGDRKAPGKQAAARSSTAGLIALASADPKAGTGAIAATTQSSASTLYSIWFYDNVQVLQADETLATGSVMEIFYAMRDTSAAAGTTKPAAKTPEAQTVPDSTSAASTGAPSTAPAEPAAATKPAEEPQDPIILYWTGKLRIVPTVGEPPVPLEPGDSVVQMRGAPVVLARDNVQIRCPSFAYRTSDGGATLNSSDAFPFIEIEQFAGVERTGKPSLTLRSEVVNYEPENNMATLGGKSLAIFPSDETDKSAAPAQASWTREGVARFAGSGDTTAITSLTLNGDVDVQHPQVLLKSQRLKLAFDPPSAAPKVDAKGKKRSNEPLVRLIEADEAVHCILLDDDGAETEVYGKHLDIATMPDAAGKLYPKIVNARGDVRTKQQGQELTAGELKLELAPVAARPADAKAKAKAGVKAESKSPALQLVRMDAKTNVRAVTDEGAVATGDTLVATPGPDGKPTMELTGKPARVTNTDGTILTSPTIKVLSSTEALAIGPGTLHAMAKVTDPAEPSREMDVTWTESALMNLKLKENQVQVVGDVHVEMPEEQLEGTQMNTAGAKRILITLVDKPAAPAKAAAEKKVAKPVAKDGALAAADVDVMKDRQVTRILLNQDAKVNSKLTAPDGSLLREMRLESSLLTYDVLTRGLKVPRPGRMIVRDHRPPDAKDKKDPADDDGLNSQRGVSAFQWAEELEYSGLKQMARMTRDVVVVYKPDDPNEAPVRMNANEVIATFEEQKKDPAAPKKTGAMSPPAVQLRSIRAEGNVKVTREGNELTAPRLTYDPIGHLITARGTDDVPAVFSSKGPGNESSAGEFRWNTETWKMSAVRVQGRTSGTGR
jgi:hypothetical protein